MNDQDVATGKHYKQSIVHFTHIGQPLDPAFIAEQYSLTAMGFTMLKKVLRSGNGDKSAEQDLYDIIGAATRELQLLKLRETYEA